MAKSADSRGNLPLHVAATFASHYTSQLSVCNNLKSKNDYHIRGMENTNPLKGIEKICMQKPNTTKKLGVGYVSN